MTTKSELKSDETTSSTEEQKTTMIESSVLNAEAPIDTPIATDDDDVTMTSSSNPIENVVAKEDVTTMIDNESEKDKIPVPTNNSTDSLSNKRARISSPSSIDPTLKNNNDDKVVDDSNKDTITDEPQEKDGNINNEISITKELNDDDKEITNTNTNSNTNNEMTLIETSQSDTTNTNSNNNNDENKLEKNKRSRSNSACNYLDVWNRVPPKDALATCTICNKVIGVSRFAQHLDKCLGIGKVRKSSINL